MNYLRNFGLPVSVLILAPWLYGQATSFVPRTLDSTRNIQSPVLETSAKRPLPEQYIWTQAGRAPATGKAQMISANPSMHYFRGEFNVKLMPAHATLYVAVPGSVKVYLNGKVVFDDASSPRLFMRVLIANVSSMLRPGMNALAIEAAHGREFAPVPNVGRVLVAKIVPRPRGLVGRPLVVTNAQWRSTTSPSKGWYQPNFNDAMWPHAHSIGAINRQSGFLRVNIDASLYDWPGYSGVSPFLARYYLAPKSVERVSNGSSRLQNVSALTHNGSLPEQKEFRISISKPTLPRQRVPSIVLDFGKEVAGWVELVSDSDSATIVTVQYGESMGEMENDPFLGVNSVYIPPHGKAHGPKSAFRYVKIRFVGPPALLRFRAIRLNGIYYPVKYYGSFESSDKLLNRIWEVGAYTAHLCMQDAIWDAPKRDRNLFAGDLNVSGDVIDSVFADHFLMQKTLTDLIGAGPITTDIDGIPGYSAFWVMDLADYEQHTNSKKYLVGMHREIVNLLAFMAADLNADHLFDNRRREDPFVDWSLNLDGDTPVARMATDFEFYRGFVQGAVLLRDLGDIKNAQKYERLAEEMKSAAEAKYFNPTTGTFGERWQTNAMAIYSGLANKSQYPTIWKSVLSTVGKPGYNRISRAQHYDYDCCKWIKGSPVPYKTLTITPYYNYYVITAMAMTGHRVQALNWIRKYWGGMIAEGATSFWEAYDPSWPKKHFHEFLQADGAEGYSVSLAHGWSSGPTVWLMQQILGIQPTSLGFHTVIIRPDLAGLSWAKGAEPTPYGLIRVSLKATSNKLIVLDIPNGVHATVLVPVQTHDAIIVVNGKPMTGKLIEHGRRMAITLNRGGHFRITAKS